MFKDKKILTPKKIVLSIMLLVFLATRMIFKPVKLDNMFMYPQFEEDNILAVNRFSYKFSDVERGDIVYVKLPNSNKYDIRRIVGLPGEHLKIENGHIYINGKKRNEDYLIYDTNGDLDNTVPDGKFFIFGDNRPIDDVKTDYFISPENIIGKVSFRIYPLK